MSRYSYLPYIGAKAHGGERATTQMVVIHATDNDASAYAEAAYASRRTDASAHFYSDSVDIYQTLDTSLIAYGCYSEGNSRSVQFELCGQSNRLTDAVMRRVAPFVARACVEFGLPIVKVNSEQLRTGVRGICGHLDVTNAWHEGDHTDPGRSFPWPTFIGYVQAAVNVLNANKGDDDMPVGMGPIQLPRTPQGHESYSVWPVNHGGLPWGAAFVSIFADLFGAKAALRIAISDGAGSWNVIGEKIVIESGKIWNMQLPTGARGLSVTRVPSDETDSCTASVSMSIEYGRR